MHTHPRYWGKDCLDWRPSRWIESGAAPAEDPKIALDNESLITPLKGSFVAWSEGIRNCPGKKFSQVEFAASIACLFRGWQVSPVLQEGEDSTMATQRVKNAVENDTGQVLLLQLLHPEQIALSWRRR